MENIRTPHGYNLSSMANELRGKIITREYYKILRSIISDLRKNPFVKEVHKSYKDVVPYGEDFIKELCEKFRSELFTVTYLNVFHDGYYMYNFCFSIDNIDKNKIYLKLRAPVNGDKIMDKVNEIVEEGNKILKDSKRKRESDDIIV